MQSTKTEKATIPETVQTAITKTVPYRLNIDNDGENSQHKRIMKAKKDLGLRHENDVIRVALSFYLNKNGY